MIDSLPFLLIPRPFLSTIHSIYDQHHHYHWSWQSWMIVTKQKKEIQKEKKRNLVYAKVIEMTQVTAASDIWSVGCLIVEVLSGAPPYFELQPMSALFRIVQVGEKGGGGRDGGGVYVKKGCMVMPMAPCMPIPARPGSHVLDFQACIKLSHLQDEHPPPPLLSQACTPL